MSRLACLKVGWALATLGASAAAASPPVGSKIPVDKPVDGSDLAVLSICLQGPGGVKYAGCASDDLDADGDVDLLDAATLQINCTETAPLAIDLEDDADDGTEVSSQEWFPDGYPAGADNRVGTNGEETYHLGLRFHLPQVLPGESFAYARLVIPGSGDGWVDSSVRLRIVGVAQDSPAAFSIVPPAQLPRTTAAVDWDVPTNWPEPRVDGSCIPLRRYSPDIAAVINEIVSRPGWGSGADGKTLALVIEDRGSGGVNYLTCNDYASLTAHCAGLLVRPTLQLYRTVRSTFIAKELLGRVTNCSVVLNTMSLLTLETYVEYGPSPGVVTGQTTPTVHAGAAPSEVVIDGLAPNTRYFYCLRYRQPGESTFAAGPVHTFHTARARGSTYCFTVQSDSHMVEFGSDPLYRLTLQNELADGPDFVIDLGDTFHCEIYDGRDAVDLEEAIQRHLDQRPYFDLLCHSAPFFLAIGNHEGEQGWRLDGTPDNVAVWAARARKLVYPLPTPSAFYGGNAEEAPFIGLRADYYAWEWGDALFVVIDPFAYTTRDPHGGMHAPGSADSWDWTLGWEQYDWLRRTLEQSTARIKFVFAHHVTGGVCTYGRGGVEAASHALGGRGSFEWGGEDLSGQDVFAVKRPGWGKPIHRILADTGVTIFFHGHDHVFVHQELDGVVYQACPQPADALYSDGLYQDGLYLSGVEVNNSGHVRVSVGPKEVTVHYIRAYLPGDGPYEDDAYTYTVPVAAVRQP